MARNVDRMELLKKQAADVPQDMAARRTASEETLGLLRKDIGKAGTYDQPDPNAPPATQPSSWATPETNPEGMKFNDAVNSKVSSFAGTSLARKLDPTAAASNIEQSSAFRQTSRMMAESEQLLARSGPLYDDMIRSTQLPILEGAAVAQRENVENIRRAVARGGAARRDGFEAAQKMRAQDDLNMKRGQAIADSHMKLDAWSRDNAKNIITFADNWSANQAGVRDTFNNAMDNAAELMSTQALPFMFGATKAAQEARDANSAAQRSKVNKWITGTVGLVVGAVGAFYGGSGESMKNFGDMSGKESAASNSSLSSASTGAGNYFGVGGQG